MKTYLFFVLTLCFSAIQNSLYAQGYSNFHFKKLQVTDGLSENTVYCILQDQNGFMWFGTKDGLNRYDGSTFKIYRHQFDNKNSLGNNFIRSIAEKDRNTLYIGTDDGMYIMDKINESFSKVQLKTENNTHIHSAVNALKIDREGNLWIATMTQGIFQYLPKKNKMVKANIDGVNLGLNATWSIIEDKSGTIWAGTRLGLLRYNRQRSLFETIAGLFSKSGNEENEILSILEDGKGDLWLGTWSQGLICYNKQSNEFEAFLKKKSSPYVTHIRSVYEYSENQLLIGSDDGLYLFHTGRGSAKRIDIPHFKHSLSDQNIYSIARDRENGIWLGTYFGGINYLNTTLLSVETFYPDVLSGFLSGKAVSQFCEDQQGNMWIATEDGGVNYYNKKTKTITQPITTSYHNTHAILLDGDNLWIGTFSRGLDVYNLKSKILTNFRHDAANPYTINDNCIFSLYKTKSGDIYVGTPVGLNRYDKENNTFIRIDQINEFIYDIKEDDNGNLWLASYQSGPIKFDRNQQKWIHYNKIKPNDPISSSKLTSIYMDSQRRLLFSSEGKGIFIYDEENDSFKNIAQPQGLPNDVIYGILDDPSGNLWLSSNKGIICLNTDAPQNYKLYTIENGFQSNQFNYKASFKSKDGKFYFGGINGFTCFYPQEINKVKNRIEPPVAITNIQLLDNTDQALQKEILIKLNKKEPIELDHRSSSFTISFVSLSYISQSKNQYAYKLEGADDKWTYAGNHKSVSYVNLAPGKYTFKVKATNNDGLWNKQGSEVSIEILPPFWLTRPAQLFYALLLFGAIYLGIWYYTKINKTRQTRQLESFRVEQEQKSFKSKIEFFTNIAHEIRTPLSLITGPLEEVIVKDEGSKETKKNLSIIEKNCDRLHVLINQLLDFRKMDENGQKMSPEKIDLNAFLTEMFERFKKAAQSRRIEFDLKLPKNQSLFVETDLEALTKVVSNLLTNAIKFSHAKIVLKLEKYMDSSYAICVFDDGKGIPDEFKSLIFDPFYQLNSNKDGTGTGIGLSLVKHLASQLNGQIEVVDEKPKGTKFIFTFSDFQMIRPIVNNDHEAIDLNAEVISDDRSLQHILVIDDNPDMTNFISHSLHEDYQIDIAEDAHKALSLLDHTSYNLIISDIMMPEIDGITLVKKIKNDLNYSHIPVILLSAKIENATKVAGLLSGADVFIEKPFSTTFLKAQIASLLRNRKTILDTFNKTPLASYSSLATNKRDEIFLHKLNEEIEKHLADEKFNVESLTDIFRISRSNFQRKLKAISGYSPGDYVRTYRLRKACVLLAESDYRISEVAFLVGFSSPSYFTKAFMKTYNMTPKEFVNTNKKQKASAGNYATKN